MADKGKALEDKFKRWCRELDIYCERFYDARSMGRPEAPSRPADFWLYIYPQLYLVECKETQSKSLAFKAFRPSQYKASFKAIQHKILYLVIVSFNNVLYVIEMTHIVDYIATTKRKSMPISWFKENGTLLKTKQDLANFLRKLPELV